MYKFKADFARCDKEKQPYCLETEKTHTFIHHFGRTENDNYVILCYQGRNFFKIPELTNVNIKYQVEFPKFKTLQTAFATYIGYNRETRKGIRLVIEQYDHAEKVSIYKGYRLSDIMHFIIDEVDGENYTEIARKTFDGVNLDGGKKFNLEIDASDNKLKVDFGEFSHTFDVEIPKGVVGIGKVAGTNNIIISDFAIESPENPAKEILLHNNFEIPRYDGGGRSYFVDLSVERYENGVCEIISKLSGGCQDPEVRPPEIYSWTVAHDWFVNPYIRFIGDCTNEKLLIKDGELRFVDKKAKPDLMRALKGIDQATKENPYITTYFTSDFKGFDYFVFGYDLLKAFRADLECDESEFVFDKQGNLVYYGRHLDRDIIVDIKSPEDKKLVGAIENLNLKESEHAIHHIKNNHYFMADEKPVFKINVWHKYDERFMTYRVALTDAYLKEIKELKVKSIEYGENVFGFSTTVFEVECDALPQSVYNISIECSYGDTQIEKYTSAFEVIDKDADVSPQKSAGLPMIYIGDGRLSGMSPWSLKPDYSLYHYVDSILCGPHFSESHEAWRVLEQYKKNLLIWYNGRTLPANSTDDDFPGTIANADYLYYKDNGRSEVASLRGYASKKKKEVYNDFVRENPQYNLTPVPEDEAFGQQRIAALKPCISEWLDYSIKRLTPDYVQEWEEVKKKNPKAKRFLYGPYSIYTTRGYFGGEAIRWFGQDPKKIGEILKDGFMQFEDYPFVCGYSSSRGAWSAMTIKLLTKTLELAPELYHNWEDGCPDGAVSTAFPPFGGQYAPPYQIVTQIFEYLYNSVYYTDGAFKYWDDNRFMVYALYNIEPRQMFDNIIKYWGIYLENKPEKPLKSIAYLYKLCNEDDMFEPWTSPHIHVLDHNRIGNVSASAMGYIYECARKGGMPAGFVTDALDSDESNMLVIPSVKALSDEEVAKIRELHSKGMKLLAVSDVTGLEDIFGVSPLNKTAFVSKVYADGKTESVCPREAEFRYTSNGANSLITTDADGCTMLYEYNGSALINTQIGAVGGDSLEIGGNGSRDNICELIKETFTKLIETMSAPIAKATNDCGINLLKTEKGETLLILTDYSSYKNRDEHRVDVMFNSVSYRGIESLDFADKEIIRVYDGDELVGFSTVIKPRQTLVFKLKV